MDALAAKQAETKAQELSKLYEQTIDQQAHDLVDAITLGAMNVKPAVYSFTPQQKREIIEQQLFGSSFSEAVSLSMCKMAAQIIDAVDKGLASGESAKKLDKAIKKIVSRRAGYLQGIAKDRLRAVCEQTKIKTGERL